MRINELQQALRGAGKRRWRQEGGAVQGVHGSLRGGTHACTAHEVRVPPPRTRAAAPHAHLPPDSALPHTRTCCGTACWWPAAGAHACAWWHSLQQQPSLHPGRPTAAYPHRACTPYAWCHCTPALVARDARRASLALRLPPPCGSCTTHVRVCRALSEMADSKDGGGVGVRVDPRIAFISDRLAKAFPQVKADKFSKAFNDADSMYVVACMHANPGARTVRRGGGSHVRRCVRRCV
ncbi:hypothetical protein EON67_00250, partial [archaeon]